MITYSPTLQGILGSRSGVAGAHLLDVMDCNGNFYYWGSRKMVAPAVIDAVSAAGGVAVATPSYQPWILSAGPWQFHRSLQTDAGTVTLQYLSGDTLQRDLDRLRRVTTLYRALFVYRYWSASAEESMRTIHGTLRVADPSGDSVQLNCRQLFDVASVPAPRFTNSEICPLLYGGKMCGATLGVECQHSYPTCQVVDHIYVISDNYEKNYGGATSPVAAKMRNRARKF